MTYNDSLRINLLCICKNSSTQMNSSKYPAVWTGKNIPTSVFLNKP